MPSLKILVSHNRLFGGSENKVKMGFLWKWCKKYKKNFSDVLERNNDYSDTHIVRRWWVGEMGMFTFFVLEVPDCKPAMLINLHIYV